MLNMYGPAMLLELGYIRSLMDMHEHAQVSEHVQTVITRGRAQSKFLESYN
jgi:hypothetical protein